MRCARRRVMRPRKTVLAACFTAILLACGGGVAPVADTTYEPPDSGDSPGQLCFLPSGSGTMPCCARTGVACDSDDACCGRDCSNGSCFCGTHGAPCRPDSTTDCCEGYYCAGGDFVQDYTCFQLVDAGAH